MGKNGTKCEKSGKDQKQLENFSKVIKSLNSQIASFGSEIQEKHMEIERLQQTLSEYKF